MTKSYKINGDVQLKKRHITPGEIQVQDLGGRNIRKVQVHVRSKSKVYVKFARKHAHGD